MLLVGDDNSSSGRTFGTADDSKTENDPLDDDGVMTILNRVATLLFWIAGGVCIGKCIHIGILYVVGTASDRSNAKAAVLPWLIGAIICFGFQFIGSMIIKIIDPNIKDVTDY